MVEIIPSILTNNPDKLRELLQRCEGVVERVHIDIIDSEFADNKTIDPLVVGDIDTSLQIDFHLMVNEPIKWVEKCAHAGADRIIAQVEQMTDQVEFVAKVVETGMKVGLAVDLNTKVSDFDSAVLTDLDVVLIMSVAAGFGGQDFNESALEKIKYLHKIRSKDPTPFRICDDGGITLNWIDDAHFVGADEVVVGNRIFKGDLVANLARFQKSAHELKLTNK